jgi:hypothetical protein
MRMLALMEFRCTRLTDVSGSGAMFQRCHWRTPLPFAVHVAFRSSTARDGTCRASRSRGIVIGYEPVCPATRPGSNQLPVSHPCFLCFFFLVVIDFDIPPVAPVAAGAVASDPDFAAAPPLVPLAPPVCAGAPTAENARAMAATGMMSARMITSPFKLRERSF